MEIRNIAIIAHVDHGKTTLVDRLLQQTVIASHVQMTDRVMDSNDLERERGITILSKTTAIEYKNVRINIVDTPGHNDFGGEVERVLTMVDSVLLLVDAVEGPMPQTRFVTRKAFAVGLNPIVVINKVDLPAARPQQVVNEVFDLFADLDANETQLDFPVVYASASKGMSGLDIRYLDNNMTALLNLILERVPRPAESPGPFQMQICSLDYSNYVGVIGIGRIYRGNVRPRDQVVVVDSRGNIRNAKVLSLEARSGLDTHQLDFASAGDIVCVTGIDDVQVSDTLCDPSSPEALPPLEVDEPTVSMEFQLNSSPLAGKAGKYLTRRHLAERLYTEASHNVALRVDEAANSDAFQVSGRGELHLAILIETMRREGYELAVSRPSVIFKEDRGQILEPYENLVLDIEAEHQGTVMELLGQRRATIENIESDGSGRVRLYYTVATRALFGFNSQFATATSGSGILTYASAGYGPLLKDFQAGRRSGVLVANDAGNTVAYALFNLQNRGKLLVRSGEPVYEGMIIGIHSRDNDLNVNPMKQKKLTNIRAAGSDENVILTNVPPMTLEYAMEFINDDELVEVTPAAIRLRKRNLREQDRKRLGRLANS